MRHYLKNKLKQVKKKQKQKQKQLRTLNEIDKIFLGMADQRLM
jgi:hypothetical protein